jgi:hypothetical protein
MILYPLSKKCVWAFEIYLGISELIVGPSPHKF